MEQIILGSNSPRRKDILEKLNINFKVVTVDTDEKFFTNNPIKEAKRLSLLKLQNILKTAPELNSSPILTADTVVFANRKIIGKPKNYDDAKNILENLSGKTHKVITGWSLFYNNKFYINFDVSSVTFSKISKHMLEWYLNTEEWKGVAGGYRIQGRAEIFIKKIRGSYSNIVGLPIHSLIKLLERLKLF